MATHHNGYSSDCGAPGAQPYNYHFANKDEASSSSDQSSSHLSFLYDRAQGNSYAAAAAAAVDPSTVSNKTHGRYISADTDNRENCGEGGEGVSRATPAPSYPYIPPQNSRQHSSPEESMACPSGTTSQSKEADVIHRQMSQLKNPQQRNCASVTSPQSSKGHEGNGSTRPRVIGGQGAVYKCPAAAQHVDPRRSHVRQR